MKRIVENWGNTGEEERILPENVTHISIGENDKVIVLVDTMALPGEAITRIKEIAEDFLGLPVLIADNRIDFKVVSEKPKEPEKHNTTTPNIQKISKESFALNKDLIEKMLKLQDNFSLTRFYDMNAPFTEMSWPTPADPYSHDKSKNPKDNP